MASRVYQGTGFGNEEECLGGGGDDGRRIGCVFGLVLGFVWERGWEEGGSGGEEEAVGVCRLEDEMEDVW